MKALALLLVAAGLLGGAYYAYLKQMPSTDAGTTPTQAISLTGVRADLLQIAQAERTYVATNGKCGPLSELVSSGALAMERTERDGYVYSVECSGAEFSAVARHAAAPAGSPTRYPNLAIDQNMTPREVN